MQFPLDVISIVKLLIIGRGILVNISHDLTQFNFFTLRVAIEMDRSCNVGVAGNVDGDILYSVLDFHENFILFFL